MKYAIIIAADDSNYLRWPSFFSYLNHNWDYSIPTYFVNQNKPYSCGQARQIQINKPTRNERVVLALRTIGCSKIIYFSDQFLVHDVNYSLLEECLCCIENHKSDLVKLGNSSWFNTEKINTCHGLPVYKQDNKCKYIDTILPITVFDNEILDKILSSKKIKKNISSICLGEPESSVFDIEYL